MGLISPGAERHIGRRLFALVLVAYLFTAGGSLTTTDAVVMFDLTENIVQRGTVALSGNLLGMESQRGRDGRFYSPFGIGQSLVNIPFYASGVAARDGLGLNVGKPDTVPKAAVALGQTTVAAAVVWLTYRLGLAVTGHVVAACLGALTLAFASVLWPYSGFGFNQPLACATLLAAITEAYVGISADGRRRLSWSGAWLGASFLTRHEMALAALPLGVWMVLASRPDRPAERIRRLVAFAPGMVVAVVIWLAYNAWRFGHPLDTGLLRDPVPALGSSVTAGLAGLLFSPSTSIFLYSPVALAGLVGLFVMHRQNRSAAWLLAGVFLTFLVFYAQLGNWIGGRSYGSRYLLVTLPLLAVGWAGALAVLPAGRRRAAALVVASLGCAIQLPGVLLDYAKVSQDVAARAGGYTTLERQWSWEASALVMNTARLPTALADNARYVAGTSAPPAIRAPGGTEDRSFSQQFAFSLDVWWLYLFYLGVLPRWALLCLVGAAGAVILTLAAQLRRALATAVAPLAARSSFSNAV